LLNASTDDELRTLFASGALRETLTARIPVGHRWHGDLSRFWAQRFGDGVTPVGFRKFPRVHVRQRATSDTRSGHGPYVGWPGERSVEVLARENLDWTRIRTGPDAWFAAYADAVGGSSTAGQVRQRLHTVLTDEDNDRVWYLGGSVASGAAADPGRTSVSPTAGSRG
jgi:hypothetical protein